MIASAITSDHSIPIWEEDAMQTGSATRSTKGSPASSSSPPSRSSWRGLDNLVVTTALPVIRERLHTGLAGLEWTVNRLHARLRGALVTGRRARGPVRTTTALRVRHRPLHVRIGSIGARAKCRRAESAPVRSRASRRVHRAALTHVVVGVGARAPAESSRSGSGERSAGSPIAIGPLVGGAIVEGVSLQWISG